MSVINGARENNYLPHHAVIKENSTTTKLRVVFDASRQTSNGKSLNDNLWTGTALQQDITSVLLKWRKHRLVVVADIEKMYRQIWVRKKDRNMQCVVWRNSPTESIKDYALNTITYGTNCAPYLAIRTLHQIARDGKVSHPIGSDITRIFMSTT